MGIYTTILPCGCEIESYLGYNSSSRCFPCVAHGGNPTAVAGRQAKRWAGPVNPYEDPEEGAAAAEGFSLTSNDNQCTRYTHQENSCSFSKLDDTNNHAKEHKQ